VGPVSFESLDGGATRPEALQVAARLGKAGIKVVSVVAGDRDGAERFRVVIRSADVARARQLLGPA
jgi:hypothetical protein